MTASPELEDRSRPGHREILLLQPYERGSAGVVVSGQLQGKAVCLVLLVATEPEHERRGDDRDNGSQQEQERERGNIGEPVESEPASEAGDQPVRNPVNQVKRAGDE